MENERLVEKYEIMKTRKDFATNRHELTRKNYKLGQTFRSAEKSTAKAVPYIFLLF